jgi:hypothetical protein
MPAEAKHIVHIPITEDEKKVAIALHKASRRMTTKPRHQASPAHPGFNSRL